MHPTKSDLSLEDIFGVVMLFIDGPDKGRYILDEARDLWVRACRGLVPYGLLNGMSSIRSEREAYVEQSVNKVQRVDVRVNGRNEGYLLSSHVHARAGACFLILRTKFGTASQSPPHCA